MDRSILKEEAALFKKYRRLMSYVKPYKARLSLLVVMEIGVTLVSLAYPYLCKPLIDKGLISKNFELAVKLAIFSGILYILNEALQITKDALSRKFRSGFILFISKKFITHLYKLDMGFFLNSSSVTQVERSNYYLNQIEAALFEQMPKFIALLVRSLLLLAICFWINPKMTLLALMLLPILLLHKMYFNSLDRKLAYSLESKQRDISVRLNDSFSKVQVIKYFGKEKFQTKAFIHNLIERTRIFLRSERLNLIGNASGRLLGKILLGAIFLYGLYQVRLQLISFGSLVTLILYFRLVISLVKNISSLYNRLSRNLFFVDSFLEVMSARPKIFEHVEPVSFGPEPDIEFRDVTFGYDKKTEVLKNVGFVIPAGQWIALLGKSGIGKTTIFNLILRLFEPAAGQIMIGGYEIRKLKLSGLRSSVRIAPQEPVLFNATIAENIRFGLDKDAGYSVVEAARLCCIHEDILRLPRGYDTLVKENGGNLSRGQRQRIALARAIINNPPVLILDEATSSLDAETEQAIYANLKKERAGLTTIATSHRSFAASLSDSVVFIKDASCVISGDFEGLLKEDEKFSRLFGEGLPEEYLQNDGNLV